MFNRKLFLSGTHVFRIKIVLWMSIEIMHKKKKITICESKKLARKLAYLDISANQRTESKKGILKLCHSIKKHRNFFRYKSTLPDKNVRAFYKTGVQIRSRTGTINLRSNILIKPVSRYQLPKYELLNDQEGVAEKCSGLPGGSTTKRRPPKPHPPKPRPK